MDYIRDTASLESLQKIYSSLGDVSLESIRRNIPFYQEEEETAWQRIYETGSEVLNFLLPYAITMYWYIFFFLLTMATIGRKLKLRRLYIQILDRLFDRAAIKLQEEIRKERHRKRLDETFESGFSSDEEGEEELDLQKRNIKRERKNYYKLRAKNEEHSSDRKELTRSWEDLAENRVEDFKENSYCSECKEINNCKCSTAKYVKEEEGDEVTSESESAKSRNIELRFPLEAPLPYITDGMRAILDDCIQTSFTPEQIGTWNLLSRTIEKKDRIRKSKSLAIFYISGLIFRYLFLMPMRILVLLLSLSNLAFWSFLVGCLPSGPFKRTINSFVVCWGFDFVAGSISVVTRFHNKQFRPSHGIAVANHTSPIDGMLLATDNCYDMVGQKTKGLLGMFMTALSKSSAHIWFERSDARDRQATTRLLGEHARDLDLPPILIFPEGVCVNNTAVLEFRKGAFEIDCDIYPIAIRFDSVYGDAFWHVGGFASYCLSMMTSWAIVCDIYYLPPMKKKPNESASLFASRVRSCIAQKAGLHELQWSYLVKSCVVGLDKWVKFKTQRQQEQQREFARQLSL